MVSQRPHCNSTMCCVAISHGPVPMVLDDRRQAHHSHSHRCPYSSMLPIAMNNAPVYHRCCQMIQRHRWYRPIPCQCDQQNHEGLDRICRHPVNLIKFGLWINSILLFVCTKYGNLMCYLSGIRKITEGSVR